jgi:hypothetical protein
LHSLVQFAAGQAHQAAAVAAAWADDPPRVTSLARVHGLDVFLARAVAQSFPDARVADAARAALEASARDTAIGALAALTQLRELIDAARAAAMPVTTYKGPVLAHQAYGDAGARATTDLDVVVPPDRAEVMAAALAALGYRPSAPAGRRVRRLLAHGLGAESWARGPAELTVDLHTRFCRHALPWDLPPEALRHAVRDVTLGGTAYPALHGGALLLAQAVHGARHGFSRLEWLTVVARLAADAASVEEAASIAPAIDARRPLSLALVLARDLCGVPVRVPPGIAQVEAAVRGAAALVRATVDEVIQPLAPRGRATRRFQLGLLELPGSRTRYRWRTATDPMLPDVRAVRLPDTMAFAYPAVRVARLGLRAMTGARGDDA